MVEKEDELTYKIRPASRHLLTIGRDLIKDNQAAIIELVKNAYDADSPNVEISFNINDSRDNIKIIVSDNGHGMTKENIIQKWLVPSTDNKLKNNISPKGRIMQGKKGIGRYAAAILGDDLLLRTVDADGNKTEIYVNWNDFEKYDYLDEVDILIDTFKTTENPSTELIISGGKDFVEMWAEIDEDKNLKQINCLEKDLKKLLAPSNMEKPSTLTDFEIKLIHNNLICDYSSSFEIEPYPILDLYDYRITGLYSSKEGNVSLKYFGNKIAGQKIEQEEINIDLELSCGNVEIDIRVYDRDTVDINNLINKGLKDNKGQYLGVLETKRLLNELSGIGVYRNGFRIRPLGDPEYDWLSLSKRRVDIPARCIGVNQVVGYINIQDEKISNLKEKSARDGLIENQSYEDLKNITTIALKELEERRYILRRKMYNTNNSKKVNENLRKLFDFEPIKNKVEQTLKSEKISFQAIEKVINLIEDDSQEKIKKYEEIENQIALYQGQATLGKIVHIVLHEGRRPLNFFKSQYDNINFWINELKNNCIEKDSVKIIS
jgi:hypothetical protein